MLTVIHDCFRWLQHSGTTCIYRVAQNKPDYSNCQIVGFILRHLVYELSRQAVVSAASFRTQAARHNISIINYANNCIVFRLC